MNVKAILGIGILMTVLGLGAASCANAQQQSGNASPDETEAIAKDAFIYAYPMLFNYKTLYSQTQDRNSKAYVGGFGTFRHYSQVYGPDNKEIVTPNNDTPYSWAWLDLRREPWVLTVPKLPEDRYYVFQWIDLFTYNFGYVGSRTSGNGAGNYLIAGPEWHGPIPPGIDKVLTSETDLVVTLGRTALNGPADVGHVVRIQEQYKLAPLSDFLHTAAPPDVPSVTFPKWDEARATSTDFISYLNFLLQFAQPVNPSEVELMQRFAKIGIAPGKPFDASTLDPATREALERGVADAKQTLAAAEKSTTGSFGLFGSRNDLKTDYTTRAVAAAMGIYGNSKEEAVYVGYHVDANNKQLVGAQPYVLHFAKKDLPPARFFWSMTLYDLPARHLVANPIDRYSIGDRTKHLKYGADGSLDLYVQHDSPGKAKEANWLPAPTGAYTLIMRIYGPKPAVFDGTWKLVRPVKTKAG
jgi:hypothetical protein